jgi:hypothetical protein
MRRRPSQGRTGCADAPAADAAAEASAAGAARAADAGAAEASVRAPPPGPGRPVSFVYRVSWSPVDQNENCF